MDLYDELVGVLQRLDEQRIDYAICGGIAVALHGYARFTKDIDLVILAEDTERVADALRPQGFVFPAGPIPFDAGGPNERQIYRVSKLEDSDTLTIDLLLVNETLRDVWDQRLLFDWQGRQISVVSAQGLAKMKRLEGRDQDLLDLKMLGLLEDA